MIASLLIARDADAPERAEPRRRAHAGCASSAITGSTIRRTAAAPERTRTPPAPSISAPARSSTSTRAPYEPGLAHARLLLGHRAAARPHGRGGRLAAGRLLRHRHEARRPAADGAGEARRDDRDRGRLRPRQGAQGTARRRDRLPQGDRRRDPYGDDGGGAGPRPYTRITGAAREPEVADLAALPDGRWAPSPQGRRHPVRSRSRASARCTAATIRSCPIASRPAPTPWPQPWPAATCCWRARSPSCWKRPWRRSSRPARPSPPPTRGCA